MFVEDSRSGRDDLLFYVKYDVNNDKDTVEVLRSDSKTLPTWEPVVQLFTDSICDRVRQNQPYVGKNFFPFFAYS